MMLILCALGLMSPLLALGWHEWTGEFIHAAFFFSWIGAYALSPFAIWRAVASTPKPLMGYTKSRKALFGYTLSLVVPSCVGLMTLAMLSETQNAMNHPHGCGLGFTVMLLTMPFVIGTTHILGGLFLAGIETLRR